MSVFGIDALFFDPAERIIYFGESKVCKTIDNAITLVNRSFADYESQISEEYKLVLSNSDVFRLSQEFQSAFERYTEVCISFEDFVKAASISQIYVPAFIAHGNGANKNTPEDFLQKMNTKITRNSFFGLDTKYLFISLPIIDKAKMSIFENWTNVSIKRNTPKAMHLLYTPWGLLCIPKIILWIL